MGRDRGPRRHRDGGGIPVGGPGATSGTCSTRGRARACPTPGLLERFVAGGDESAFAALVDAARGAGAEHLPGRAEGPGRRRRRVPGHVRAALPQGRRRSAAATRWGPGCTGSPTGPRSRPGPTPPDAARSRRPPGSRGPPRPGSRDDLGAVLHEEIERLPERFRLPVVLCYLEGMTRDQAADYLRCTEGTVRGRLAKGRELLRHRLDAPRAHPGRSVRLPARRPGKPRRDDRPRRGRRGIGPGRRARRGGLARRFLARLKARRRRLTGVGIAAAAIAYRRRTPGRPPGEAAIRPASRGRRPGPAVAIARPSRPTTGPRCRSRGGSSISKAARSPARRSASSASSRPPAATSMPGSTRSSGWAEKPRAA